jgi:hypothetical protein
MHFIWPQVRAFIDAALVRTGGRFLAGDVLDLLLNGKVRLWVSWNDEEKQVDAAIVTEIIQYPRLRELRIWLVGGRNMKAWFADAEALIAEFARDKGCAMMASGGRHGWLRVIGAEWRQTGPTWERNL